MTKDLEDILLEKKYASRNDYWKDAKKARKVFIPRKLGRKNPKHIKTDSFDFVKVLDKVQSVSDKVKNASDKVSNIFSNVKNTSANLNPKTQVVPSISKPEIETRSFSNLDALKTQTIFNIPLPFAVLGGIVAVLVLIKLFK